MRKLLFIIFLVVSLINVSHKVKAQCSIIPSYTEIEPNESIVTSNFICSGSYSALGNINPSGDRDFFKITLAGTSTNLLLMVDVSPSNSVDPFLTSYTAAGAVLHTNDDSNPALYGELGSNLTETALPAGTYYADVKRSTSGPTTFSYLFYAIAYPSAATAIIETTSANDLPSQAQSNPLNCFSGSLSSSSDVDYYSFTATANDIIYFINSSNSKTTQLYSADGTTLLSTFTSPVRFYTIPTTGTYYFKVSGNNGSYLLAFGNPYTKEIVNGIDDNCNGAIDETGVPPLWYFDADFDTYGNPANSLASCTQPSGYVANNTDCNDASNVIHPGATEVCNTIDENCDGQTDEGVTSIYYLDADQDGFGNMMMQVQGCTLPNGYVTNANDCNDNNASIYLNAIEISCNNIDESCNGIIDENDPDTDGDMVADCHDNCPSFYNYNQLDLDGNLVGDVCDQVCNVSPFRLEIEPNNTRATNNVFCGTGYIVSGQINPSSDKDYYNLNLSASTNDVLLYIDEAPVITSDHIITLFNSVGSQLATDDEGGIDALYGSHAPKLKVTSLASGSYSAEVKTFNQASTGQYTLYAMSYPSPAASISETLSPNDTRLQAQSNPLNAFSGTIASVSDTDYYSISALKTEEVFIVSTANINILRADGSVLISSLNGAPAAIFPVHVSGTYFVKVFGTPGTYHLAIGNLFKSEIINGIDDNCNGSIDEAPPLQTYYADADHDGYGNAAMSTINCETPSGYVSNSADCNDTNASIHPGVTEICNAIDDNCNSQIDESGNVYYQDADNDGYGNPLIDSSACILPLGYVTNSSDCNDNSVTVFPGSTEISCNHIDDNCSGQIDENDADVDADGVPDCYDNCLTFYNPAQTDLDNNNIGDFCQTASCEVIPQLGETEPNDAIATSNIICTGNFTVKNAVINPSSDKDIYKITLTSPVSNLFLMTDVASTASADPFLILYNSVGVQLQSNDDSNPALYGDLGANISFPSLAAGTYYAEVRRSTSGPLTFPYTLYSISYPLAQNAIPETILLNDFPVSAQSHPLNCFSGNISSASDVDYYSYSAENNETVYFINSKTTELVAPDGTTILSTGVNPVSFYHFNAKGVYYFKVSSTTSGSYLLAIGNPYPKELDNGIDDNCNGFIDEHYPQNTYYKDADLDGYGEFTEDTMACAMPIGYVLNGTDNCIGVSNINQLDQDNNFIGDVCEQVCSTITTRTEIEPNNSRPSANTFCGQGYIVSGVTSPALDKDYFSVTLTNSSNDLLMYIDETPLIDADHIITLLSASGSQIGTDDDGGNNTLYGLHAPQLKVQSLAAGTYFSEVKAFNSTTGQYTMYLMGYPSVGASITETNSPNDTKEQAQSNSLNSFSGTISNTSDIDYYSFSAAVTERIFIVVNGANCELLDSNGVVIISNAYGAPALIYTVHHSGNYFLKVSGLTGSYHLAIGRLFTNDPINGIDDNCNGNIDELPLFQTFYQDMDGDGFGNAAILSNSCDPIPGYVSNNTDCNDESSSIHSGNAQLTVNLFIQGYYLQDMEMTPALFNAGLSNDPTDCDSVTIELHDALSPETIFFSTIALLKTNGTINTMLSCESVGRNYFIVIKHRNSIETWSKSSISIGLINSIDFSQ